MFEIPFASAAGTRVPIARPPSLRYWRLGALGWFCAVAIVFHAWGHNPFIELYGGGDGYVAGLPSKIFSATLSAWNPWVQLGQYTYPNTQFQPFYPPGLIWMSLFPNTFGYNLFILSHYIAAGIFGYLFLRNLRLSQFAATFGASCFELSGFLSAHKGHQAMLTAAVWLPLMLYFLDRYFQSGERRHLGGSALAVGMSLLAGFPQATLYSIMVFVAYAAYRAAALPGALFRERLRQFAMACGVSLGAGILLSAVQLAPVAASLPQMTRERLSFDTFSEDFLPVYSFLCFLVPNLFGGLYGVANYATNINFVELYPYMGLLPLGLAIGAVLTRRRTVPDTAFWGILALVASLLALGANTPLHRLMYYVPVYSLFRASARHLFEIDFAICVLAAYAVHTIFHADSASARRLLLVASAVLVAAFSVTMAIAQVTGTLAGFLAGPHSQAFKEARVNSLYTVGEVAAMAARNLRTDQRTLLWPTIFLLLTLAVVAVLWAGRRGIIGRAAVMTVTLADLYCVHTYIYVYPDTRPAFHSETRQELAVLRQRGYDPHRERVYPLEPELLYTYPLLNMLNRVATINDYTPMWLTRYQAFGEFYPNGGQPEARLGDPKFLAVTGARYLLTRSAVTRERLRSAQSMSAGADVERTFAPASTQWTLVAATRGDAGFVLRAAGADGISLGQTAVPLQPRTPYLVQFEAMADGPIDRPLRADLYDGAAYDHAAQDRMVRNLSNQYQPHSLLIDSGPDAPPQAFLRLFTQSTVPIRIRAIRVSKMKRGMRADLREIATTNDGITIFENTAFQPRFRFAKRLLPAKDLAEAQAVFDSDRFDPAESAIVEGIEGEQTLEPGRIVSQTIGNTRMEWRLRTPPRSFFVVADSWFPGWSAQVDEKPARIYPVNGFTRGVFIEGPGEHRVTMTFLPASFYVGLFGTALGVATVSFLYKDRLREWQRSIRSGRGVPQSARR
jgi:hypothetical protein